MAAIADIQPALPTLPPNVREFQLADRFILSVDLGQAADPTAISVLHYKKHHHMRVDGVIMRILETFDVRHLARLPLGLSYVEQVQEVKRLLLRPPLVKACELVIDETGVGRAVGDLFDATGLAPTRVSITAGDNQTAVGRNRWHVAKSLLISHLDARLHTGELRIAKELTEASALGEELKDFRRKVSAAGRYSYEARVGKHDDLVLAVAIGLWAVVGRPKSTQPSFGFYGDIPDRRGKP